MHQGGDYDRYQAEANEAILHVLHHSRQNNQVCVERSEDRAVDVAALRRKEMKIHRGLLQDFTTALLQISQEF